MLLLLLRPCLTLPPPPQHMSEEEEGINLFTLTNETVGCKAMGKEKGENFKKKG
jgi:hypothetical protein